MASVTKLWKDDAGRLLSERGDRILDVDALHDLFESLTECVEDSQEAVNDYVMNYGERWRPTRLAHMRRVVDTARAALRKATGEDHV